MPGSSTVSPEVVGPNHDSVESGIRSVAVRHGSLHWGTLAELVWPVGFRSGEHDNVPGHFWSTLTFCFSNLPRPTGLGPSVGSAIIFDTVPRLLQQISCTRSMVIAVWPTERHIRKSALLNCYRLRPHAIVASELNDTQWEAVQIGTTRKNLISVLTQADSGLFIFARGRYHYVLWSQLFGS